MFETTNQSIRVSFRDAYDVEKCTWLWQDDIWTLQTGQKSENGEKANTHEVRRGFTFPTDFSRNSSWDIHTNAQMYQGHKTLRLRSEMCLLKMLIIPLQANPHSCLKR